MHLSPTPQDFLDQSLLLIQARPGTTRITTTYSSPRRISKRQLTRLQSTTTTTTTTPTPAPTTSSPGSLTLKTYDPISGSTIKFNTNKVSDVARLIGVLGRAARGMAGVPQPKVEVGDRDALMVDAPPGESAGKETMGRIGTPVPGEGGKGSGSAAASTPGGGVSGGGGGGGGGRKKKKGGKR